MRGPGGAVPAGARDRDEREEAEWSSEPPWQRPICEIVCILRERAEYALAAEVAEILGRLSARYDRPGEWPQQTKWPW